MDIARDIVGAARHVVLSSRRHGAGPASVGAAPKAVQDAVEDDAGVVRAAALMRVASDGQCEFSDGASRSFDEVVFCTGYRLRHPFCAISVPRGPTRWMGLSRPRSAASGARPTRPANVPSGALERRRVRSVNYTGTSSTCTTRRCASLGYRSRTSVPDVRAAVAVHRRSALRPPVRRRRRVAASLNGSPRRRPKWRRSRPEDTEGAPPHAGRQAVGLRAPLCDGSAQR